MIITGGGMNTYVRIKDARELLILFEKAIQLFSSEKELCKKIDLIISRFESGETVYSEEIKELLDVINAIHRKNISMLKNKEKNKETNDLIVDFFEVLGMGWLIRNVND